MFFVDSLSEFKNVEKELFFSNSISVVIVTLLYLLVNIAFISVISGETLNDGKINQTIAATFFSQLFGGNEKIVRIFTFLIVLSIISSAATNVWSGSRVIVTTARSNFFPIYSEQLKIWHEYFNTSINALILQFIWNSFIILIVGSSFTITNFELFSSFSMYSYWIFYVATGIGLFVIQHREHRELRDNVHEHDQENNSISSDGSETKLFEVPLFITVIFILAGLYILIFSFVINVKCPESIASESIECSKYLTTQRVQQIAPFFISYGSLFIALMSWYYWWKST
ncbi:12492_t:CDS:2 [Funneliformis caledonium]|uniref:12492_t:CDS:1 n=1 Tax=Funneliformis caledonium TaxID=1117310 RepID=A0A9N9ESV9_9GLOM|nr:12492_t:CDS:2 [Funneliformis caledonium]